MDPGSTLRTSYNAYQIIHGGPPGQPMKVDTGSSLEIGYDADENGQRLTLGRPRGLPWVDREMKEFLILFIDSSNLKKGDC